MYKCNKPARLTFEGFLITWPPKITFLRSFSLTPYVNFMIRFCVKKTPNGHESALIAIILSYLVVKGFFLLSWLKGKDYSCTRKELAKIGILSHEEPDYIVHDGLLLSCESAHQRENKVWILITPKTRCWQKKGNKVEQSSFQLQTKWTLIFSIH